MAERVLLLVITNRRMKRYEKKEISSEMEKLIDSSGGKTVSVLTASVDRPSPASYIHSGKVGELKTAVARERPDLVICSVDLSPTQLRNIEKATNKRVVDRTGLILDIFAHHATTHEGKLQIELAQLNYLLPRLSDIWEQFSRLGGGIGTRGPGEQKLEIDRRKIKTKITKLKKELDALRAHRARIRQQRRRQQLFVITIVGYTNAGKSTLLNQLTGASVLAQDKLFATLDPTTRRLFVDAGMQVLITDTVGFLRELPHTLIEAFKATLEEITESDLILDVIDISDEFYEDKRQAADKVLADVGAGQIGRILVLNKSDMLTDAMRIRVKRTYPQAVLISARSGYGIEVLRGQIKQRLEKKAAHHEHYHSVS